MRIISFALLLFVVYPATSSIASIPATGIPPRISLYSCLVSISDKIYSFGGLDTDQDLTNEIREFELATSQWTTLLSTSQIVPSPRMSSVCISYHGSLFIFGGQGMDGIQEELWKFNIAVGSWQQITIPHSFSIARTKTAYTLDTNLLYVFGGITYSGEDNALIM